MLISRGKAAKNRPGSAASPFFVQHRHPQRSRLGCPRKSNTRPTSDGKGGSHRTISSSFKKRTTGRNSAPFDCRLQSESERTATKARAKQEPSPAARSKGRGGQKKEPTIRLGTERQPGRRGNKPQPNDKHRPYKAGSLNHG